MWWQYFKQLWEARLDRLEAYLAAYLKALQAREVKHD
jgi:hypothetical protein